MVMADTARSARCGGRRVENNRQTILKSFCLCSGSNSRLELYLVDEVTDHAVPRAVQELRSIFTVGHLEER